MSLLLPLSLTSFLLLSLTLLQHKSSSDSTSATGHSLPFGAIANDHDASIRPALPTDFFHRGSGRCAPDPCS
ncbi:MAG TPA: hypothetical protein V6C88_08645 [Chroococcidiopsis sp.]